MSTWDISNNENWTPDELPKGDVVLEAGNSTQYITGGWRSQRPVWKADACKHCLLCWMHCPDSSILVADGKVTGIDYDHCKGCGVCVHECKFGALEMVSEADAKGGN
jgi:pyruvate ferredoxin oxidoreductase delta subunit